MPRYRYKAKSEDGRVHCGTEEADSGRALFVILKSRGLYCYEYSSQERTPAACSAKLNQKQLPLLCRQIAAMLTAGVSLSRALEVSAGSARDKPLIAALAGLRESIHKGRTLSEAMEEMKGVFPNLLIYMTRTGESSGRLDELLHKMAEYYGREEELNGKVRAAMTYPVILFSITVMAAVFMLTMVLPRFASMLQEQELPWITRMMMRLSFSLCSHGFLYIMLILILMALFKGILKCPSVRLQADRAVLYTPIIGKLLRTVYTSRFASAFAVLYGSGIGILDAMHTVGRVMGNSYVEKGLAQAAERLKGGVMLSQALEEQDLFQPVLISMVAAGEESGALDMVLKDAGSFYEKEAARAVNQMIALLEPAMILILALVVGSVVMAIMMPVFNMYSSML